MNTSVCHLTRTFEYSAIRFIVVCCGLITAFSAEGDEMAPLVERSLGRLPAIQQLRTAQKAGEALDGLIVPVPAPPAPPGVALTAEDQTLLEEENSDRRRMYELAASQIGIDPALIGRLRAESLRDRAGDRPAFWYQLPDTSSSAGFRWLGPGGADPPVPPPQLQMPLYVLTRPAANLYADASTAQVKGSGLPVFKPFFVLEQNTDTNGQTWYQVADGLGLNSSREPVGWLNMGEVLPWDHRLVVEFTNRSNRGPVFFFENPLVIRELIKLPEGDRRKRAGEWQRQFESGTQGISPDAPGGIEPRIPPAVTNRPYIMPVLSTDSIKVTTDDGITRTARIVRLASATRSGRKPATDLEAPVIGNLDVDIVFVMDTTGSMQPYIDALLEVITKVVTGLVESRMELKFQFGFVGYQDATTKSGIEYTDKVFTESLLQASQFKEALRTVRANRETQDEYEEDVIAGVHAAITKCPWRPKSLKLIIHAGDAPPLPDIKEGDRRGDPGSTTGLTVQAVRDAADAAAIGIFSIQVLDPAFQRYHEAAERAFGTLALNRGMAEGKQALFKVDATDLGRFREVAQNTVNGIVAYALDKLGRETEGFPVTKDIREIVVPTMDGVFSDYQGQITQLEAPSLSDAYALSRDCAPPHNLALQACVLLNRSELGMLYESLNKLLATARGDGAGMDDLLNSIRKLVVDIFRDPNRKRDGASLEQDLARLPYRSTAMDLSAAMWQSYSADQKASLIGEWQGKANYYAEINSNGSKWVKPRDKSPSDEEWTPIKIEQFP
jgi:serine/threonine-protein kinase PpkA